MSEQSSAGGSPINEQTASVAEPIIKTGGETTSFDELEAVVEQARQAKSAATRAKNKAAKEEAKVEDESESDEKPKAKAKESSDDSADEEAKDSDKEDSADVKDKEQKEKVEKAPDKVKIYKVKAGDSEVPIPANAKLTVTVNGKQEQVSVQDIISNYAGKTDWNRKYTELDRERKTFSKEREPVEALINGFVRRIDNPLEAQKFFLKNIGHDPDAFEEKLLESLEPYFAERLQLSPEERRQRDLEAQNQKLKARDEERLTSAKREQAKAKLAERWETVRETHNLTPSRALELFNELKASGHLKEEQITPELIGDYHAELTARDGLKNLLTEIGVDAKDQGMAIGHLRDVQVKNPDFSLDDLKMIAREAFGGKTAKTLSKKLAKSAPVNTNRPSAQRRADPILFSDLDE